MADTEERGHATLKSVAELAGVSTATVVRVLRENGPVSAAARERVLGAVEATGYRINIVASGLRRQRTDTIGHILSTITRNPFNAEVSLGLELAALQSGYGVLIANAQGDPQLERASVEAFLGRRVDAIVFTTPISAENVERAMRGGTRVVQVERPTSVPTARVLVDNYVGSRALARHLVDLGHRRIVYVGPELRPGLAEVESERVRGYLDTMAEVGAPATIWPEPKVSANEVEVETEWIGFAAERLPADRPTAIVVESDLAATKVLQALHALRLRVPDQISVAGFDDTYAAYLTPALTTVALPMRQMGAAAFRAIQARDPLFVERLETALRIRHSTAAPPRD